MLSTAIIGFIQGFGRMLQKNPNEFLANSNTQHNWLWTVPEGTNEGLAMDMTPLSTQSIYLAAIRYKAQS